MIELGERGREIEWERHKPGKNSMITERTRETEKKRNRELSLQICIERDKEID